MIHREIYIFTNHFIEPISIDNGHKRTNDRLTILLDSPFIISFIPLMDTAMNINKTLLFTVALKSDLPSAIISADFPIFHERDFRELMPGRSLMQGTVLN